MTLLPRAQVMAATAHATTIVLVPPLGSTEIMQRHVLASSVFRLDISPILL